MGGQAFTVESGAVFKRCSRFWVHLVVEAPGPEFDGLIHSHVELCGMGGLFLVHLAL